MPIIPSTYHSPWYYRNGHLQTIWPAILRKVTGIKYRRERITTPDDDFLDLDWSEVGGKDLVIISHGLEGSSATSYALGMCKAANSQTWDAVVWNLRGCSETINRKPRYYHSGETGDLHTVITHILNLKKYRKIYLVGFSVGGNISLKYLGEGKYPVSELITCAVTFSVPCDLGATAKHLASAANFIYMKRFIKSLTQKIKDKAVIFPHLFALEKLKEIHNFEQFDSKFTAPLYGYASAQAYWNANSCKQFLPQINIPSLIVTALNDPFFPDECYPRKEALENKNLFLEMPKYGGHCGFGPQLKNKCYWSEHRAIAFIKENNGQ